MIKGCHAGAVEPMQEEADQGLPVGSLEAVVKEQAAAVGAARQARVSFPHIGAVIAV